MRKACLSEIYGLAKRDERVLFFGSDLGSGTLSEFKREIPDRFFMEGIAEANIIGVMSGLAMNGKIPYLNAIAVFLTRRCYEQALLDAAMQNLKIRLIGSGGGLVYAPLGPTHIAFEDMALMRAIPNMTVVAPCDAEEMKRLMPLTLDYDGPMYIRLGKGGDPIVSPPEKPFVIGKAISVTEGKDALIVSTGIMLKEALDASYALKEKGISAAVLHMHTLKPIDAETLLKKASGAKAVVTVEEHSAVGGLGCAVAELILEAGLGSKKFKKLAIPDTYPNLYGSQELLLERYGLKSADITQAVLELLR